MEKPKFFIIRRDDNNLLWEKYIKWLNKIYNVGWSGNSFLYYGYDGSSSNRGTYGSDLVRFFKNNPTLITLEQWKELFIDDVLPEKWCVKGGEELVEFIKDWEDLNRITNIIGDSNTRYYFKRNKVNEYLWDYDNIIPKNYTEITVQQLRKYYLKEKPMKTTAIKIPLTFLENAYSAMNEEQRNLVKANVDCFGNTTEEFIKQYYEKQCCEGWKEIMEQQFPFLIDSKYLDLSKDTVDGRVLLSQTKPSLLTVRTMYNLAYKAFHLNPKYNWEILKDEYGALCLIPTKK